METLQSTIFIEFDVNTKKITFLRGDNIVDYDSNVTSVYVRVKYKNLSGDTVYLTPFELKDYKFSLYTIKPATNNVNVITGKVTDELKENVCGGVVKFEIPRVCTNRLGIVKCEIHINQGNKTIGSSTFVLDVKQSLVTAFDDELLGDEDFPVLKQLILEIQKASNIDDNNRSKITTYSSDKIETIKKDFDSQVQASDDKIENTKEELSSRIKEKANLNEVKEEISKAQLEGSSVDTTNFAMKSDYDFIKNGVFETELTEIKNTLYEDNHAIINDGKVELASSSNFNTRVVNVSYKETYAISSRMTSTNLYVILYTDDNDVLIKSDLKGTNTDVIYTNYQTVVPLGATKLYVTMQDANAYPTIMKVNHLEKLNYVENRVSNIENILYATQTRTIDGNILVDSHAKLNNDNTVEISPSTNFNLIVADVGENEEYLISSRLTSANLYVILYTDDNDVLIKSDLKGTNTDVIYTDYRTIVPFGATKLYITIQEADNTKLPTIKKVEKINKLNVEGYSNLIKIKDDFRYLVPTFSNASFTGDGLILLGTNNLTTFDLVEGKGLYNAAGSRYFRDPAIIKINGYYYIMYTECGFDSGNKIGMIKTKDFLNFEELELLELPSSESDYYQVWAPAWFREDNDIYIISSCRYNSSESFKTIIHKYDPDTHTATFMRIITEVIGHIDGHIYKENNKYYIAIGGAHMYVSNNLLGGYTKITNNNLDYTGYEANYCVRMDDGRWIMYMQELGATFGTSHMVYVMADSLDGVWSDPKPVTYTKKALDYIRSLDTNEAREYFHWTVFDFNNALGNNNNY